MIPGVSETPNPATWFDGKSIEALANAVTQWRGLVQNDGLEVRSISEYPYNCVGMIFAARRAPLDIGDIEDILRWDGYRQIRQEEVVPGDIILYKTKAGKYSHVALVIKVIEGEFQNKVKRFKVISKWGPDPEFEHYADVGHYPSVYGLPAEYWTERVPYEPERHINDRYIRRA